MSKTKSIELTSGFLGKGYRYSIRMEVYKTGSFKAKGRIRAWWDKTYGKNTTKHHFRHIDRQWFIYHLGKEYMENYEVHHEWENNARCLLLSPLAHRRKHYALFKP